jgi:CubicO group peptidase (beta-lactamase class C family)
VLESRFFAACEAAAARWEVPAMALGFASGADTRRYSFGCEPDARFRIASLTKPVTASLVIQLVDLEATTGIWPDDVRVHHLLSHLSGFDGECGDLARFGDGDDALTAAVAELPRVRRWLGSDEVWSYANAGYWLAAWLAARVADTVYEDALRRHVLAPAGMEATGFDGLELPATGRKASAKPYPRARRPSGGLVSNVDDLLRFARWHLAQDHAPAMRVVRGKPPAGVYGLGLWGQRVAGVGVWGHDGSYGGFQSKFLIVPDRQAAFVGLTNSGRGGQALDEIADLWFEALLGARRRIAPTVPLAPEPLAAFAGRYENGEQSLTVAVAGDGLGVAFLEGDDRGEVWARPIGRRTFEVAGGDFDRTRFDFPVDGFGRFGSRLAARVP